MSDHPRIVVAGAGAIGCYVGGLLAADGRDVYLLGRSGLGEELAQNGLTLTDFDGAKTHVAAMAFETDPKCLSGAEVVLVAVKSAATAEIAGHIAEYAPSATVVSLQNGISNADTLRAALPDADVRGAVVAFNVAKTKAGTFHQGTSGGITIEAGTSDLSGLLTTPHLATTNTDDIVGVQWGKLLVNLNNALNALSGVTLLEQLKTHAWRRILAAQMTETLAVLKAANIAPAKFSPVAPQIVPHILRLPNPLFTRIAKAMLTIDPHARSSMQDDLTAGRLTEIDALQGEVLRLAAQLGIACPTIERVTQAIRAAEQANSGLPNLRPQDV